MDAVTRPAAVRCCSAHPPIDVTDVLLNSSFFRDLSPAEAFPVARRSRLRRYGAGEILYAAGDPAAEVFVVVAGQLKERILTADGDATVTDLVPPGGTIGEPGLFAPERTRIVDLVAVRASHVVLVPRDALLEAITTHSQVALRVIEALATDARWLTQRLAEMGRLRVRDRLIIALRDLAAAYGKPGPHGVVLPIALTHTTLAERICATRENVARAMAELTAAGAVVVERGVYHIDAANLATLARDATPLVQHRHNWSRRPGT